MDDAFTDTSAFLWLVTFLLLLDTSGCIYIVIDRDRLAPSSADASGAPPLWRLYGVRAKADFCVFTLSPSTTSVEK